MGKKKDENELADLVAELIADVGDDRDRLISFTEKLIAEYSDSPAGIAEYVAKLTDASTRQLQVKAGLAKALAKRVDDSEESDSDEISREIGLPFPDEEVEESN